MFDPFFSKEVLAVWHDVALDLLDGRFFLRNIRKRRLNWVLTGVDF
jgi:hypothetical protein